METQPINNEEFPAPTRTDPCRFMGGVPLGGIGAGTIELRADGSFREWQILNNWGNQLSLGIYQYHPPYDLLNAFLAVRVDEQAYVLETHPPAGLPGVEGIEYDGKYPFAHLKYSLPRNVPIELSLEAFSAYVPHHPEDSGLPAFGLTFTITNTSSRSTNIALALALVNPLGHRCMVSKTEGLPVAACVDGKSGLAVAALDGEPVCVLGGSDDEAQLRSFWSAFVGDDTGPATSDGHGQRLVQIVRFTLEPGQAARQRFAVGWFFPDHRENGYGPLVGHQYEQWVDSAAASAALFARRFDELRWASAAWRYTMLDASWPAWVTDWLINLQSNLAKSTWWVKDGRWILYESVDCPNMGPVHIIDLANWIVLDAFPELELGLLRRYAASQYENGQLPEQFNLLGPHAQPEFGWPPSITFTSGRDLVELSPKYAVEVFHRYKETGDEEFLAACYPAVKRAMRYAKRFDQDSDGLPDHGNGGQRTSWDLIENGYIPSYTATMWLAGAKAAAELADAADDRGFAEEMRRELLRGQQSIQQKLWNGEFYAMWADEDGSRNDQCFIDQIYGDLLASFVGLGSFLPPEQIGSTLLAQAKYNSQATPFGLVCIANRDGSMYLPPDDRVQIIVCWMLPTPIALIAHGEPDLGLAILKRVYDLCTRRHPGGLWDTPQCIVVQTGDPHLRDFHHYLRTGCLWALLKVLNGWNYNAVDQSLAVGPILRPEDCHGPWIVPPAYGTLRQEIAGRAQRVRLQVKSGSLRLKHLSVRSRVGRVAQVEASLSGRRLHIKTETIDQDVRIDFEKPVDVRREDTLDAILCSDLCNF